MLYEAGLLGVDELSDDDSECGMPVSVQTENLRRVLASRLGEGCCVESTDLYSLQGVERDVAIDAMVAGEPSPFVLIDGELVCKGAVKVDAVLNALQREPARVGVSRS